MRAETDEKLDRALFGNVPPQPGSHFLEGYAARIGVGNAGIDVDDILA